MLITPRSRAPLRTTHVGFTLMEVALAASIMVVVVAAVSVTFMQFMRNQSVHANHDLLHRSATSLQEVLALDLLNLSRVNTFDDNGRYRSGSSGPWVLWLRDPGSSVLYSVTYAWDGSVGSLRSTQVGGVAPGARVFPHVESVSFSNLTNDHVVVEGFVSERWLLSGGGSGQVVPFRASGIVRMR